MNLLLCLIEYCVSLGLCVGDGEDCFRDFMPEEPDDVIVLHEYSGDPLNPFTTNVHRSVQIKVRGVDAEHVRHKAVQLCEAFRATTENRQIHFTDSLWGQVYIRQTPFKLSQDKSGRITYCFNLGITTNILE
jgi:hypothetical protein